MYFSASQKWQIHLLIRCSKILIFGRRSSYDISPINLVCKAKKGATLDVCVCVFKIGWSSISGDLRYDRVPISFTQLL